MSKRRARRKGHQIPRFCDKKPLILRLQAVSAVKMALSLDGGPFLSPRLFSAGRWGTLWVFCRIRLPKEGVDNMADTDSALSLDGIRASLREPLTMLVEHLRAALGNRLQSITVVGSSLTEDFQPGSSDINTVVVLERPDVAALDAVAALAKPMRKHKLSPPLLMTPAYIDRSRDVFGIEFLDFQLRHETIVGADPFASLHIEKADVRLQCERELKATLVRLRQGYIAAAGNKKLVRDILISTAKGLAPLARAMLWLRDIERPKTMAAALRKAAGEFQVDLNAVVAAERWRYEKPRLADADIQNAFTAIVGSVEFLTTTVDKFEL